VGSLESFATLAESPVEAEKALTALGYLRAEAAIPVLVEHLLFAPRTRLGAEMLADYPCAVALCRIGSPAAAMVIKRMAGDEQAVWLGTQVLLCIDGPQLAAARLRLTAEAETDEATVASLTEAATRVIAYGIPELEPRKGRAEATAPK